MEATSDKTELKCGIVMPISAIDGCTNEHWSEVQSILREAISSIEDVQFDTRMVSDADESGLIHKRIIQNLYSYDMVVCDVSGKNPNVMFELGMRLAFDKPTVIIKDDATDFSFDTGVIEHIIYPRDLRFSRIVQFKTSLATKVKATHSTWIKNPSEASFLKNFGQFSIATINDQVVSPDEAVVRSLRDIQMEVERLNRTINRTRHTGAVSIASEARAQIRQAIVEFIAEHPEVELTELINSRAFAEEIERRTDPQKYFDSRVDFIDAVNSSLAFFLRKRSKLD